MVVGLLNVNASAWMLLRGGGVVFVALMKHFLLRDSLLPSMWIGVFLIAGAVVLVCAAPKIGEESEDDDYVATRQLWGGVITIVGTFVQSVQYTWEEKVMAGEISAPPWLLIGVEGVCGTVLCTFVLYPLAYLLPGHDHGSYESPANTMAMLANSPTCLGLSVLFCALVFTLNSFSVLVTFMMPSLWHAVLDNVRPIAIWFVQLVLFYLFSGSGLGEAWTLASDVQLVGLALLLFGTAVYNGSIKLPGVYAESLVGLSSPMSSPALSRSPLITLNRSPRGELASSPYVSRVRLQDQPRPEELMGRAGQGLSVSLLQADQARRES